MNLYDKVSNLNSIFGVWQYTKALRITYVAQKWLIVWDHKQTPPVRYDCQGETHHEACTSAVNKLNELITN